MPVGLTVEKIINNGLLDALANRYHRDVAAQIVLQSIGFPRGSMPAMNAFANSREYWFKVCSMLSDGLVEDGLEKLLESAAKEFPGSKEFQPFGRISQGLSNVQTPDHGIVRTSLPALARECSPFISYSRKNSDAVHGIARIWDRCGLRTWLDVWSMPIGASVVKVLQVVLANAKHVVIFVGPEGLGPWQELEYHAALGRAVYGQCQIYLILLPGAKLDAAQTLFLKTMNPLVLDGGPGDAKKIRDLGSAILGRECKNI